MSSTPSGGVAALLAAYPWFERVPSKANLSDAVSRLQLEEARAAGWLELSFDFSAVFETLATNIDSDHYLIGDLVDSILRDFAAQRVRHPFLA